MSAFFLTWPLSCVSICIPFSSKDLSLDLGFIFIQVALISRSFIPKIFFLSKITHIVF